tara:strand:+ start:129 stop:362 length:234 start_codon:yes stop_codon:yes gene_type:complete
MSDNKDFLKDLKNFDCLISLSSKILKQAFNMGISCLSYGFSGYYHLNLYQHLSINKEIDKYDFLKMIKKKLGNNVIY